jgi:prepilin-type N-terminal cleavage/methylation domain-containing protein
LKAVFRQYQKRAFSLIEVLLVLALVAVMVGIVAGNAGAFIQGSNFEPPDRVLKKAVLDAVYHASEKKQAIYLSYFEGNATFLVTNKSGGVLAKHQVYDDLAEELDRGSSLLPRVNFQAIGPLSGEGGDGSSYDEQDLYLNRVRFHSGSSTPFLAEIEFRETLQKLFFDPFSGYVLKNKE